MDTRPHSIFAQQRLWELIQILLDLLRENNITKKTCDFEYEGSIGSLIPNI